MTAQHKAGDVFDRNLKFIGEEMAEARRVQNAGHADDHMVWEAGKLAQRPYHRIERVGDADDKCIWCVGRDTFTHCLHDL